MRPRSVKSKALAADHDDRGRTDYEIRSVTKALDLLEAICEDEAGDQGGGDEEVRVTELSKRLGMSKSAVFRLLATFENRGYVERIAETGIYRVGVNAFEVGRRLLLRMGLLRHARPVMEELSRQCNEAIYLAIRRGGEFLLIDLVESAQQVKVASLAGKRFPLVKAAPGQVLLAYSSPADQAPVISEIRARGYCVEQGGLGEMVSCLAAPFFDNAGSVAGAICVVGPTYRLTESQIDAIFWPQLKAASESISSKLGYLKPYAGTVRL